MTRLSAAMRRAGRTSCQSNSRICTAEATQSPRQVGTPRWSTTSGTDGTALDRFITEEEEKNKINHCHVSVSAFVARERREEHGGADSNSILKLMGRKSSENSHDWNPIIPHPMTLSSSQRRSRWECNRMRLTVEERIEILKGFECCYR